MPPVELGGVTCGGETGALGAVDDGVVVAGSADLLEGCELVDCGLVDGGFEAGDGRSAFFAVRIKNAGTARMIRRNNAAPA